MKRSKPKPKISLVRNEKPAQGSQRRLLTRKQVQERYGGVCSRTINRWEKDKSLGFPAPMDINGHKYYDEVLLTAFDRKRAARSGEAA